MDGTTYYQRYFDADDVPIEVLGELGAATCLCTIAGRSDHHALLDAFVARA